MKSALVIDCDVNAATLPEYLRPSLKWRKEGNRTTAYLPAGTMFDERSPVVAGVPQALFLCQTGQAAAVDDECAQALGMTPDEARREQRRYAAAAAGIKGKNDHELFMAEVIDGYETADPNHTDSTPVYKPGKHWAAYAEAQKQKDADPDE